jgi:hypothetical protein
MPNKKIEIKSYLKIVQFLNSYSVYEIVKKIKNFFLFIIVTQARVSTKNKRCIKLKFLLINT